MGKKWYWYFSIVWGLLVACDPDFYTLINRESSLSCKLPEVPVPWHDVLGSPAWRLEWYDAEGSPVHHEVPAGTGEVELSLDLHQTGPIYAWPYWPQLGIEPYRTRPAGALLPLDIQENQCELSWFGGIETTLFRFLGTGSGDPRYGPEYFNWSRFRSLFAEAKLPEAVLADPWCVDWRLVAEKTKASGFDSRRLVPRVTQPLVITLPVASAWVSGSPFAASGISEGSSSICVQASSEVETFLSTHGILCYSWDGMAYIPGPVAP